ncbi:MAG: sugar ABC transporter substrate-binding protein [Cereibacter sphaeroides]|uniref:Sugar ABC transporter substrate-binding protein n=1 Tax=Cereibacter sphaeroides TaxID=1063 RepID=A0A2W5TJS0_CERSP|nr:MAG: sugar ABC transporter substrate-binding protein [Cereibacter sphaeroides]
MKMLKTMAAATALAVTAFAAVPINAQTLSDPGPAEYAAALKDKRVILIPMAMGFDLAQGWAAIIEREVKGFGGVFETRDPNWSTEAATQAIIDATSAEPKPDVLVVMPPDLNSFSRVLKRAQDAGIFVLLIDNPANFAADAYLGSDWTRLGELEAEEAVKVCGEGTSKKIGLVQGDEVNATSMYQYEGIMKVLANYPDIQVVAKPVSNWDPTTSRSVTATMLQQYPDVCAIIDFWDGDATGAAAAIRDAGLQDKVKLITTGGGEQTASCDMIANGTYHAVVTTELVRETDNLVGMIKYLLQSGVKPGEHTARLYTQLHATTKENMTPTSCWSLKALQAANQ